MRGEESPMLVTKVLALLENLTTADLAQLPPAERRRLADRCRYVADLAEPPRRGAGRAGVLAALGDGERSG
jgi:hypothetical protein